MSTRVYNGTNFIQTHTTGDYIHDNTNATGSSIFRLGADGAGVDFQIQNNSETAQFTLTGAGVATFAGTLAVTSTSTFTGEATFNGGIQLNDNDTLNIGAGDDLSIVHNGTNTSITSQTGDLTIDNTNTTGSTIFALGTDTTATDFQIQNNSGTAILTALGNSTVRITDNASFTIGTGDDLSMTHNGTNTTLTSQTGDLIVDNTNATGSSIFRLGADGAGADFQIQNNSATAQFTITGAGVATFAGTLAVSSTSTFTGEATFNGGIQLNDSDALNIGAGDDLSIVHNGTNTTITSQTGDLTIDNTNATGSTIFILGTDTTATDFQIQNNSATAIMTVRGDSTVRITDNASFTIGTGDDLSMTHNGTNTTLTSQTGDLIVDNTNATGSSIFILGTDTGTTDFQVQNNSGTAQFTITGAGVATFAGTLAVTSTSTFTGEATFNGGIQLNDNDTLNIGTGDDLSIVHNGTNTTVTSQTGDLTIDNTNATGSTIFILGTDTTATDFQIQNNSATAIMTVFGDSTVRITDNASFTLGTGDDVSMSHDGTNTTITTQTGNLLIDNTNTTGKTIFRLGTDTVATDFEIRNNSDTVIFAVDGSGNTIINEISYVWPSNNGDAEQFLKTDGAGTLSWASSSASVAGGNFVLNDDATQPTEANSYGGLYFTRTEEDILSDTAQITATTSSNGATNVVIAALQFDSLTASQLNQSLIKITSGATANEVRQIISYNGSDTVTVNSAFSQAVGNGDNFEIYSNIYTALVHDPELNGLRVGGYGNSAGVNSFISDIGLNVGTFRSNGLATLAAGANCVGSQTLSFGNGAGDQGTIKYQSAEFTIASTDNATMSIGDNLNNAYNRLKMTLGGSTGNTRFEVSDGSTNAKFTVNDNGNVSIVDSFYRQATLSTTDATQTDIFTYNCAQMNSIIVESDIIATNTDGSGYGNLNTQSFKLIASFAKSGASTFTQVGSTDKLSLGAQAWDADISTSGNFLLIEATGEASTDISWKALNKITYILDSNL